MSEKEKAAQEASEAEAQAPATDEQPTEGSEDPQQGSEKTTAELAKELAREQEARKKAEAAAAENAFKLRDQKRQERTDEPESSEDRPLTRRELEEALAREREATRKELENQRIAELATSMSSSDDERDLIVEIHRNRRFPDHLSLEEQLEESFLLANKRNILGENRELKRAVASKGRVSRTNFSGSQDESVSSVRPPMPAQDAAEMKRNGFEWNAREKRYEKKLSDGSLLVKNPGQPGTKRV